MSESTLQLEAALLIPGDCNHCLEELQRALSARKGIERVHLTADPPRLCLHFDPNLVSMTVVERMAQDAGGELQSRFHHLRFRILSNHAADMAASLEHQLQAVSGVLHAHVNLASSSVSVAYDNTSIEPEQIEEILDTSGIKVERIPSGGAPMVVGSETQAPRSDHQHLDKHQHHGEHQHDHHHQHPTEPCSHGHKHEHDHHHETCSHTKSTKPCDHDHDHKHKHGSCDHGHSHGVGCEHGAVPQFLPSWMQKNWTTILVVAAGLFFSLGWSGEFLLHLDSRVSLSFYILAYIAGGYDISTHAIPGLFKGRFNTDILMLAAAGGAAILGQWAEGAFLLFLFALGHAGEHYALDRARHAIDALATLVPQTALLLVGEEPVESPVESLKIGQLILVRPGDRIAADGRVHKGNSNVDQSPITGESVPVAKNVGDQVFAGTVNVDTALVVAVEKLSADSTLSRVMLMVSEAQDQKSPTQDFTQRFAAKFVPAVLLFTVAVIFVPPLFEWLTWKESFYRAMLLLVASSPCALALGTPAAVLAGIGQAARNGVLIKGGLHLENLGRLNAIAFDKTGTLTDGVFQVSEIVLEHAQDEAELLRVAGAVEQQSNHPIAKAVLMAVNERKIELPTAESLENLPGLGVKSALDGKAVWIGSRKLFRDKETPVMMGDTLESKARDLEEQGKTVVLIAQDTRLLGLLAFSDKARTEAARALKQLSKIGIKHLVMLTGDNEAVARSVAAEVGVNDVRAGLMPEDKLACAKELKSKFGKLAMVGDGVNDAPALAICDVGIAMGGAGTAVALETADVALMADDLSQLPFAVGLSRLSQRIVQQNLAISLGVICMLIVTSVSGVGELSWTVAAHEGSTLVVVGNALRLLSYRAPE